MGEYADEYIDSMIGGWQNFPRRLFRPRRPRCRFCGSGPLIWQQQARGVWRLYDAPGKQHKCTKQGRPADASEFPYLGDPE